MKYKEFLFLMALIAGGIVLLASLGSSTIAESSKLTDTITTNKNFVVLELFTSEGCSSCPPADALFATLKNDYAGKPIYLLAFHVDYWDRQGWKDVFSNACFTERQGNYQEWLHTNSVYTPQVVINGTTEIVGSDNQAIYNGIANELKEDKASGLILRSQKDAGKLTVQYDITNGPQNGRLQVAIVQKAASTEVKRGENKGRLLTHVQIVRRLYSEKTAATGNGLMTIHLPDGFTPADWEAIAFLQDYNTGNITAAGRLHL